MAIKFLDSKELKFSDSKVKEISAIAYKNNILYALSDKGFLYHFGIEIRKNKIKNFKLLKRFKLKNSKNKRLKKDLRDAEGIAFFEDNLLLSFEREPRVELFSKKGKRLKNCSISTKLQNIKNYKSKNKALEALAYSKKYGIITAPELPLKKEDKKYHKIYAKDRFWKILACGSLTSFEFIDEDRLMILQREFNYITRKRVITISELNLKTEQYKILAKLNNKDKKQNFDVENFEGLAHVTKNRFLMISDDNNSFFQKTILVLFELQD
jgi:hypothetical protein